MEDYQRPEAELVNYIITPFEGETVMGDGFRQRCTNLVVFLLSTRNTFCGSVVTFFRSYISTTMTVSYQSSHQRHRSA